MWRFILEVIVFSLISMLCFSAFGQNWQDEEHVWNEEKGEWEVSNKAGGRVVGVQEGEDKKVSRKKEKRFEPPAAEWARYLPKNVKRGYRQATEWEISEAQRKLWAKEMMTVRAMQRAQERRQLMAYRKSVGWYAARRSGGYNPGYNAMLMMHMQAVNNYVNGGGYRRGY